MAAALGQCHLAVPPAPVVIGVTFVPAVRRSFLSFPACGEEYYRIFLDFAFWALGGKTGKHSKMSAEIALTTWVFGDVDVDVAAVSSSRVLFCAPHCVPFRPGCFLIFFLRAFAMHGQR